MINPASSIYGTCVALDENAALILGESGMGKSDLAYRFMHLQAHKGQCMLVSDDQVKLSVSEGQLLVSPPDTIKGMIELRGVGLISVDYMPSACLKLIVNLVEPEHVPRMQVPFEEDQFIDYESVRMPHVKMSAFEVSAPYKLREFILAACNLY